MAAWVPSVRFYPLTYPATHGSFRRTRSVEARYLASMMADRIGRATRLPSQLGQTPLRMRSAQAAQKVHSKVQMRASALSGDRSTSQHSQLGFIISMATILAGTIFTAGSAEGRYRIKTNIDRIRSWRRDPSSLLARR